MQTTIKWTSYPSRKAERTIKSRAYTVLFSDGKVGRQTFTRLSDMGWWAGANSKAHITHFALPEDITTTYTQKEGEE